MRACPPAQRRKPRAWKLRAALVLALGAGQLLGLAHELLVPHVWCEFHGGQVHATQGDDHRHLTKVSAADPARANLAASAASSEDHDEAHCALAARLTSTAPVPGGQGEPVGRWTQTPRAPVELADSGPSVPLLLQAPKSSPPRV